MFKMHIEDTTYQFTVQTPQLIRLQDNAWDTSGMRRDIDDECVRRRLLERRVVQKHGRNDAVEGIGRRHDGG